MKNMLEFFKGYRISALLGPFFKLTEAILELLVPMIVAFIIDDAIPTGSISNTYRYIGMMFILGITGLIVSLSGQYFSAKAAVGFTKNLSEKLYKKIILLSKEERDILTPSSLVTRMTSDVNQIQTGLNLVFRLILRAPLIVFGSLVMAMMIDLRMTLYFLGMIIILFIIVGGIMYFSNPLFNQIRKDTDRLVTLTREQVQGIRVIRAYHQEDREIAQFEKNNKILTEDLLQAGYLNVLTNPLTYIIVNTTLILIIWQGGHFVFEGTLSQGQLVALINYLLQILVELVKLAGFVVMMNKANASANRINDVLNQSVESQDVTNSSYSVGEKTLFNHKIKSNSVLIFDGVSFVYPESAAPAVTEIDFVINQGEFVGLIGGTGSGKTTLIQLITQTYQPTTGSVSFNPKLFDVSSKQALRDQIAVVPGLVSLFKGTIRSNLLMGFKDASEEDMWKALECAQAAEFVREKEGQLDAPVVAFGRNFSGGQRQRLTIARALIKPAKILIFDDSTSALDFVTEANFQNALKENYSDRTIIMVSQRTRSLEKADQIIVLDQGLQVGLGTHNELLRTNDIYREIYESQQIKEVNSDE